MPINKYRKNDRIRKLPFWEHNKNGFRQESSTIVKGVGGQSLMRNRRSIQSQGTFPQITYKLRKEKYKNWTGNFIKSLILTSPTRNKQNSSLDGTPWEGHITSVVFQTQMHKLDLIMKKHSNSSWEKFSKIIGLYAKKMLLSWKPEELQQIKAKTWQLHTLCELRLDNLLGKGKTV